MADHENDIGLSREANLAITTINTTKFQVVEDFGFKSVAKTGGVATSLVVGSVDIIDTANKGSTKDVVVQHGEIMETGVADEPVVEIASTSSNSSSSWPNNENEEEGAGHNPTGTTVNASSSSSSSTATTGATPRASRTLRLPMSNSALMPVLMIRRFNAPVEPRYGGLAFSVFRRRQSVLKSGAAQSSSASYPQNQWFTTAAFQTAPSRSSRLGLQRH